MSNPVRPRPTRRLAALVCAVLLAGCGAATMPPIHSEAERLAVARRMIDKGDDVVATELLKTYIANNIGSADVDQAIYLLGYAYLQHKDWVEAGSEFERLLKDYPESDSSAAARYRLAESEFAQAKGPDFDQDHTLRAIEEWQRYLNDFPGHWLNASARERVLAARTRLADKLMRTGHLYLKLHQPGPARVYFAKVAAEYGDTSFGPEARIGLALADAHDGRRDQAIALLDSVATAHPGTPAAQRALHERKRLEKH